MSSLPPLLAGAMGRRRAAGRSVAVAAGAVLATFVFLGILAYSLKLAVIVLLGMIFVPVALVELPLAICAWVVLLFLSSTSSFGEYSNRVLIFASLCWLASLAGRRIKLRSALSDNYKIVGVAVVFVTWVVVSLAWAPDPGADIKHLKLLLYGGLSFLLVLGAIRDPRHFRWIAAAFVVGAVLSVLYGAAKGGIGASTGVTNEVADAGRFQGGAGDPNYLGAELVPALMLAGGLAVRRVAWRRMLLLAATIVIGVGLAATQSRGGLLAAGACALVALVTWKGKRRQIAILILLAAASTALYFMLHPGATTRLLESNQGSGRLDIWTVAWRIIHDHPFFGVGFGQFPKVSPHYVLLPGALQYVSEIIEQQIVVHDLFLQVWVEEGVVGLLLFLTLIAGSLLCGWRAIGRFDALGDVEMAALSRAAFFGLIGFIAASFFLADLENGQLWLILAMGPLLASLGARRNVRSPATPSPSARAPATLARRAPLAGQHPSRMSLR